MKKFLFTVAIIAGVIFGAIKGANTICGSVVEKKANEELESYQYAEVIDFDIVKGDARLKVTDARLNAEIEYYLDLHTGDMHVIDATGLYRILAVK